MQSISTVLQKLTGIREDELGKAAWSALLFFLILCGYYILRPLREQMGLAGGVRNLPQLYLINLGVMLALAPVFGAVATRWARRTFVPAVYLFFMLNMLVFFGLNRLVPDANQITLGRVQYVWISVYNMWAVSLFWAFMADNWGLARSKRIFGFISVGGSAGAIAGSSITSLLIGPVGKDNLILVSAALMLIAALVLHRLGRDMSADKPASDSAPSDRGHFWSGLTEFVGSPYLLAIGLYMFLFTVLSTFLYFMQAEIVDAAGVSPEHKTQIFANIDLAVNILALGFQLFLTGRLMSRWGVGRVLLVLPAVSAVGFAALAVSPALAVLVVFQVLRRAGNYALSKPARETLYTIVNRDQKYKAKSFIDTFVYRGGDALGSLIFRALGGLGLAGIAMAAVPASLAWGAAGLYLGRKQKEMAEKQGEDA